MSDDFILSGSDLYSNTDEDLNWRTKNNLIGMQLGLQWTWGWDRFQLSTEGKVGLFANVYSQQGTDSINGSASYPGFDVSHSGTDLSALFEFSLLARFRLTECMWLRAGYQYYCATGLATGPRQLGGLRCRRHRGTGWLVAGPGVGPVGELANRGSIDASGEGKG